jgi:hypothetical protein
LGFCYSVSINPFAVANKITTEDYTRFSTLDYQEKVRLFDKLFGLVPFDFPVADLECLWFTNEIKYNRLVEYFNLENRNKHIYKRTIRSKNKDVVFDVRPLSKPHRIFFNQYVVSGFLAAKDELAKQILVESKRADSASQYLEEKQEHLLSVVDWARHTVNEPKTCLRHQFLRIFLNGFRAYQNVNDELVKTRRKFVELFLYSQGLLLAGQIDELQKRIDRLQSRKGKTGMNPLQKILLLHELGVIELLQKKFSEENLNHHYGSLAELISLICFDGPPMGKMVAEQISALTNTAGSGALPKQNPPLVGNELSRFGL